MKKKMTNLHANLPISDLNDFNNNNFAPNDLLVQDKNEDTNYGIPILSLVITGAVSVGTSLLLMFGAKMFGKSGNA